MLSEYAQQLLNGSTSCHSVELEGGLIGIYNGLASWGRVEDGQGNLVQELGFDMEVDEDGSQYQPTFFADSFESFGYKLAKKANA